MPVAEKIHQYVQRLPQPLQTVVLDFVEYLLSKVEHGEAETDWSALSIAFAMRDMDDETTPAYTRADLKAVFP